MAPLLGDDAAPSRHGQAPAAILCFRSAACRGKHRGVFLSQSTIRRIFAGELIWSLAGNFSVQALNLIAFLSLARILGPEPYGIVGLAAVALSFAWSILVEGSAEFLVRARTVSKGHINATFWLQVALALVLSSGMAIGVSRLAAATSEPELARVLPVLCGVPLLYALASAQRALLQRALRFRLLAVCSLVSALVSGVVGIIAALEGAGAMSLASMMLVQWAILAVLLWRFSDWRPSLAFSITELRDVAAFGGHMVVANLAGLAELQGVRLLVGLMAGPTGLGLLTMGWRIVEVISMLVLGPVIQVAVPTLAALQHDRPAFRRKLTGFLRLTVFLSLPAYTGLMLVAPVMVPLLFGAQWAEAVLPLRVLCLLGIGWAVSFPLDAAIISTGQVAWRTRLSICGLGVVLGGSVIAVALGQGLATVTLVSMALVLRQAVVIPLYVAALSRRGLLALHGLVEDLLRIAASAGLMLAVVLAAERLVALPEPLALPVAIGLGAAVYVAGVLALARDAARDAMRMLLPFRTAPGRPEPRIAPAKAEAIA